MPANLTRLEWHGPETRGLSVELAGPSSSAAAPVVFVPSLGLSSDWCFYPLFVERMAEDRPVLVPQFTAGAELAPVHDELRRLLLALGRHERPRGCEWRHERIALVGHGFGASLALLLAARTGNVGGIVSLGAFGGFDRVTDGAPEQRDAIAERGDAFALEPAVRALRCPAVLVHGEEDGIAPISESERLFQWIDKGLGSLVMLEKTGHSLGAKQPFDGSNKELDRAIWIAREFLRREL
jgi:pimeloyl-ACP methyl ester carboxylesterase